VSNCSLKMQSPVLYILRWSWVLIRFRSRYIFPIPDFRNPVRGGISEVRGMITKFNLSRRIFCKPGSIGYPHQVGERCITSRRITFCSEKISACDVIDRDKRKQTPVCIHADMFPPYFSRDLSVSLSTMDRIRFTANSRPVSMLWCDASAGT